MEGLYTHLIEPLDTTQPCGFIRSVTFAQPKVRLLLLPDWQGASTAYSHRMADMFAQRLQAETLIFHPYGLNTQPSHYMEEGRYLVYELLSDRQRCREWLQQALASIQGQWANPSLPLVMVGFCLGGTLAFEAARCSDMAAHAYSLHGNPRTDLRLAIEEHATAMVYVDGGSDPLIPRADVNVFMHEMQHSPRPWFNHTLGRNKHSFSKREVGFAGPGSVYDPEALSLALGIVANHVAHLLHSLSAGIAGHSHTETRTIKRQG